MGSWQRRWLWRGADVLRHVRTAMAALLLAVMLGASITPPAQAAFISQFFQKRTLFSPWSMALGHVNLDGKVDLVSVRPIDKIVDVSLAFDTGFAASRPHSLENMPYAVAIGDLNEDNKPDLLVGQSRPGNDVVTVLTGNGDGTFVIGTNVYLDTVFPEFVALADLNGDQNLDAVAVGRSAGSFSVLLGNGDGTFQAEQTFDAGGNPASITATDVNADAKLDVIIANEGPGTVSLSLGNGDGTFQARQSLTVGPLPKSVAVKDFNADGKIDLATANTGGLTSAQPASYSILLGNGDGTFQAAVTTTMEDGNNASITTGDFNGDTKPDLAIGQFRTGRHIVALLGNGDGTFGSQLRHTQDDHIENIARTDLNNDGLDDLVATSYDGSFVRWYFGAPSGTVEITSPTVAASEGGNATITLTRTGNLTGPTSVVLSATGGTATQGQDYTMPTPITVSWNDAEGGDKTATIPIVNDVTSEQAETIQLKIALPAASWSNVGAQATATVTIAASDIPAVSVEAGSALEGNSGTTPIPFRVTLSGPSTDTVTVQYATSDGGEGSSNVPAKAGSDYVATSGSLTFTPGETEKTILVQVIGDTTYEGKDEWITMTLSNPTNASLGTAKAYGFIRDDEEFDSCTPRPKVEVVTTKLPDGRLQVTVTSNEIVALASIQFGKAGRPIQNATVQIDGRQITSQTTVPMALYTQTKTFTVARTNPAAPMMVPFIVTDGCGTWETFVGLGTGQ